LTDAAQADFYDIISWTAEQFGELQARRYEATITQALAALIDGPNRIGARTRGDILPELMSLHVARAGNKGRHFILFRLTGDEGEETIEVLRILHDAMDLARHVRPRRGRDK
jgi:toxin ParE1/3/4